MDFFDCQWLIHLVIARTLCICRLFTVGKHVPTPYTQLIRTLLSNCRQFHLRHLTVQQLISQLDAASPKIGCATWKLFDTMAPEKPTWVHSSDGDLENIVYQRLEEEEGSEFKRLLNVSPPSICPVGKNVLTLATAPFPQTVSTPAVEHLELWLSCLFNFTFSRRFYPKGLS